jgi:hypothetical protein
VVIALSFHMSEFALVAPAELSWRLRTTRERINAFSHSAQRRSRRICRFALFEALSDLLIMKDVLTRNEVDELLARTASRLQTSPDEVGHRTADFVRQLSEAAA